MIKFLYHLSPDQWSAVGQWLGAAATVWAVIVSLRLAREAKKNSLPSVKVSVTAGFPVDVFGVSDTTYHFVEGVNDGNNRVNLTGFHCKIEQTWREKLMRKQKLNMWFVQEMQGVLPKFLEPADKVLILIPTEKIIHSLKENHLGSRHLTFTFQDTLNNEYKLTKRITVS